MQVNNSQLDGTASSVLKLVFSNISISCAWVCLWWLIKFPLQFPKKLVSKAMQYSPSNEKY
jgi:hypothetical protein